MVYKFRVILDTEEDVFRDIAIMGNATLEDLHNSIVNAFGFDGMEIASFYTCDQKWTQNEEISLFDIGDIAGKQKIMSNYILSELLNEENTKLIYVYDFLNMWTFLVELAAIEEHLEKDKLYPHLLFAHGELPIEVPNKDFNEEMSNDSIYDDFEDEFNNDDFDMLDKNGDYEDLGFEENWN